MTAQDDFPRRVSTATAMTSQMSPTIVRPSRLLEVTTIAFFVALLCTGIALYRDYGISWDEPSTREMGLMNVNHLIPDIRALDSLRAISRPGTNYERFGPLFEIVLVRAEQLLQPPDSRSVYMMRHLLNFLTFFLGVVLFHRLCWRRFGSGIALLASVSLVASPQLFSHAFYNTKDISFLTAFVGAMLALDSALNHPTWRSMLVHAMTTAVLVGTRVIGLFAMLLTAASVLARRPTRRMLVLLVAYGGVVVFLLPLVWPVLRIDPIGIVKGAVFSAASNPYYLTNLFRGEAIPASRLPWDYVPTWILITTPMVLSALFLIGTARVAVACVRSPRRSFLEQQRDVIVLSWFFLPVLGAVVLRPILYDGWRHYFFVYPAFVYLAAIGMEWLSAIATRRFGAAKRRAVAAGLTSALFLGLAPAVWFMVANHPYEHLYFNRFAGRDMKEVKQRFEFDYWGLSYRKALEYIVRSDTSHQIRVRTINFPGVMNALILDDRDRRRLYFTASDTDADYFVSNYRFHPEAYPYPEEVFQVRVGNASAASVFRLHPAR
jgi:hypothetical protein